MPLKRQPPPKAESPGAIRVDATAAAKSRNHLQQRAEKRGVGQKIDGVKQRVCVVAVLSVVACSFCCSEEQGSAPERTTGFG